MCNDLARELSSKKNYTNEEITSVLSTLDRNQDGKITMDELYMLMRKLNPEWLTEIETYVLINQKIMFYTFIVNFLTNDGCFDIPSKISQSVYCFLEAPIGHRCFSSDGQFPHRCLISLCPGWQSNGVGHFCISEFPLRVLLFFVSCHHTKFSASKYI